MEVSDNDKSHRGNASQFFVPGELCRRGYAAVVTLGNSPNTDVLCSNCAGTKFVYIQVKTFLPGIKTCSVGRKAEKAFGPSFFWVIAGIPDPKSTHPFRYYVVPCAEMAANVTAHHQRWMSELGRKGQARKDSNVRAVAVVDKAAPYFWNISDYENRWDLIEALLSD